MDVTGLVLIGCIRWMGRFARWHGVAHGLIAELGVGTVTATTLQLVLAVAALMACLGGSLILLGAGLQWASCSLEFAAKARASKSRVFKADRSSALDV